MMGPSLGLLFAMSLGTASIFSRRGLEYGSFYALLVISLLVGSLFFLPITAVTTGFDGVPMRGVVYAAAGAVVGSVLGRATYFVGIEYLGPGKSLSITATAPLYGAVFASVFLDERITPLVLMGTVGIVLGIFAVSKDVRTQTRQAEYSLLVVLIPLASAVTSAIAVTLRKIALSAGIAPLEAGAVNMVVGLFTVAPLLATQRRADVFDIDSRALWNFTAASVVMALGFVMYFVGLRITSASVFFPLVQTQPLFAVILSGIFLRQLETITRWTLLGSAIIVGGASLVILG